MRLFFISLSSLALSLAAQPKNLPYINMFTNSVQRAEFVSVRTGVTTNYDWDYATTADPHASHDYPVGGTSTDTISDWLFSPPMKVTLGAVLAFKYYVYGISGSATPSDQFSIWYGKRNTNPHNGTYIMLADLTSKVTSAFEHWQDTGFTLPFAADTGYVVFRYRATTNWFTLGLDSVSVIDPNASIKTIDEMPGITLMPNPCSTFMQIEGKDVIENLSVQSIDGRMLRICPVNSNAFKLDISELPQGTYLLSVQTVSGIGYKRFVKY